jgi:site-specific recombinase XerD
MLQFLNIRFNYLCRTTYQNEQGQCPLVLRIIFRGERRDIFTGLFCFKENWDSRNNKVLKKEKLFIALNRNLDTTIQKAVYAFEELKFSGDQFTIDELVDKIKGKEVRPTLLIDFLEEGNLKMKNRVGMEILQVTYMKYKRSVSYMRDFLQKEFKVKNFSLQKVDTDFLERYFQFLRTDKKIAHNTASKYMICVKTIFLPAIRNGIIKPDPFYGLKIAPKPVFKEVLTQDEIDKIVSLQLTDPDLDRKRDIFLFACYTGLAYIDLQQLNTTHIIKESDNTYYIRKPRQKTGQDSIIPLLPVAMRILMKYSLTGNIADFNWFVSTNQKMNKGLKYIGRKAGIAKDLHMHLARHTFATTVTLANGIPIETVSKMLGHASIKQTQHYAKVIPLKIKLDMDKIKDLYK